MPPKKDEAALRADVRKHREWAEKNLDILRSRTGNGFQGKLRQLQDQHEQVIYNWLARHRTRAQELPLLRHDLEALDFLVSSVAEPASPCAVSGTDPAQPESSSPGFLAPQTMSTTPNASPRFKEGTPVASHECFPASWNATPRASGLRRDPCAGTDAGTGYISAGSTAVFAGCASHEPCRC